MKMERPFVVERKVNRNVVIGGDAPALASVIDAYVPGFGRQIERVGEGSKMHHYLVVGAAR